MTKEDLLKTIGNLGFPLFSNEKTGDANKALAEIIKSRNLRFLEGFPVVLANSMGKGVFNLADIRNNLVKHENKNALDELMMMSLALFKVLGLKFTQADKYYRSLDKKQKEIFSDIFKNMKDNKDFTLAGHGLSSERLKSTFNNYSIHEESNLNDLLTRKKDFGVEYALSQIFSSKQKELFLKKLKREHFSKTEKEYYSRTVKKKVLALANTDLHDMAAKVLDSGR